MWGKYSRGLEKSGRDAAYKKGRVLTPAASALIGLIRNTIQKQVNDLYHLSYVYSMLP